MTATMMKKIEEAKKLVAAGFGTESFIPSMYETLRYGWKAATPTWATLKKYATEAGLIAEDKTIAWHSDGSALATLCGIAEGTVFHYTAYHF